MTMYKSQIQEEHLAPKSPKSFVSAWGEKKKQMALNSKPVPNSPPKKLSNQPQNEVEVQVTFSWKISSKAWTDHKEHLENCKKDLKIAIEYDPISTIFHLNDIAFPDVLNFNVTQTKATPR